MSRQVAEAVKIRLAGDTAINSKEEYTRRTIPTLEATNTKSSKPDTPPLRGRPGKNP